MGFWVSLGVHSNQLKIFQYLRNITRWYTYLHTYFVGAYLIMLCQLEEMWPYLKVSDATFSKAYNSFFSVIHLSFHPKWKMGRLFCLRRYSLPSQGLPVTQTFPSKTSTSQSKSDTERHQPKSSTNQSKTTSAAATNGKAAAAATGNSSSLNKSLPASKSPPSTQAAAASRSKAPAATAASQRLVSSVDRLKESQALIDIMVLF